MKVVFESFSFLDCSLYLDQHDSNDNFIIWKDIFSGRYQVLDPT